MEVNVHVNVTINENDSEEAKNLKSIINGILNGNSLIPVWRQIYLCENFNITDYTIHVERLEHLDGYKEITHRYFAITGEEKETEEY